MSASSVDRESFQKFLASAYAVQESGLDTQSLSALVELQRLIATSDHDADQALHLVAERARDVAQATGVAIALLKADQLVYKAGSGSAAPLVGRRMTAILSVSGQNEGRGEILRVENAQSDARIQAAICRQFEAQSLLILPVCRERTVAGVLEILFDQAHVFEEREVRTYRLMTRLVEDAMFGSGQIEQKKAAVAEVAAVPVAVEALPSQKQEFYADQYSEPERWHGAWIGKIDQAITFAGGKVRRFSPRAWTPANVRGRVQIVLDALRWNVPLTSVVFALVIAACWITYNLRPTSSPVATSSVQQADADRQQAQPEPEKRDSPAKALPARVLAEQPVARPAFQRVRVGSTEVDYVADDVTIRHFTLKPGASPVHTGYKQVNRGNDVTVRYFGSKSAVMSQAQPVSGAARSAVQAMPVSK
jgi:hypothetical protein